MTSVLKKNDAHLPFFNQRITVVGGLDALGMQNSSVRAYSMLLPGLNNVTGRIRYYSFYCWLIHNYYKINKQYSSDDQLRYIRFSEYIIALLAHIDRENPMQGIPGSLHAGNYVDEKSHKLIEATFQEDKKTRGTYWAFKWGAFGQYYLGALRTLGLVESHKDRPNLYDLPSTEDNEKVITGELLADAFEESILVKGTVHRDTFLKMVNNVDAVVDNETLLLLRQSFDLTKVIGQNEKKALIDLLVQADYPFDFKNPSYYRKDTIIELLIFLRDTIIEKPNSRDFTFYAYKIKGQTHVEHEDVMRGWYYYQFNEFWQYTNSAILNGLLNHLVQNNGSQSTPLFSYLNELTEDILKVLEAHLEYPNIGEADALDVIENKSGDLNVIEMYHLIEKKEGVERIGLGFIHIWQLFNENKEYIKQLTSFYIKNELGVMNRFSCLGYFSQLIKFTRSKTLKEYIYQYLHQQIIYRHQVVALRKMPSTLSKTTQKFQLEDNEIRYLRNLTPTFTGPRIGNLMSFLYDLGFLDENYSLTDSGQDLLKNLANKK